MKPRRFLALGVAIASLSLAAPALADNGPHGGFTPVADGCAGCHRTHTASAPGLLTDTAHSLCLSCHGSTATGADTNVIDGVYSERDGIAESPSEMSDGISLRGGGFVNVLMDSDWDGTAISSPATSTHIYNGATGTAWGKGDIGSGVGSTGFSLTCTSCHDPHGGASTTGTATYRLLRAIPTGSGAAAGIDLPDVSPKLYTLTNTLNLAPVGLGKTEVQYFGERGGEDLTAWCSQCHTRYLADSGSAATDSGDPNFSYRHMTRFVGGGAPNCSLCHNVHGALNPPNVFNIESDVAHNPGCTACHVAHGSSAHMTGYASDVEWPDGSTTPSGDARSSLLRVDNRGVCQFCHEK